MAERLRELAPVQIPAHILTSGHYDVDTWDPDDLGDHTHDADEPPD